eukprot:13535382-Alexandrium_andersonii.AAC.1
MRRQPRPAHAAVPPLGAAPRPAHLLHPAGHPPDGVHAQVPLSQVHTQVDGYSTPIVQHGGVGSRCSPASS